MQNDRKDKKTLVHRYGDSVGATSWAVVKREPLAIGTDVEAGRQPREITSRRRFYQRRRIISQGQFPGPALGEAEGTARKNQLILENRLISFT